MKKVAFYAIMNELYSMGTKEYVQYIRSNIIKQQWFKMACRDEEIRIRYFARSFSAPSACNVYATLSKAGLIYSHKYLLLEFHISTHHHYRAKMLNINLINRSLFNLSALLVSLQGDFVNSNDYSDLVLYSRKAVLELYKKHYVGYMDLSIISKIINFNFLLFHEKRLKLSLFLISKNRLYAYYMQAIYQKDNHISDAEMSDKLALLLNVLLSRRSICSIRQRYTSVFLLKASKNNNYYDYEQNFTSSVQLIKLNISQIQWNSKGVYELLSDGLELYPLASSRTVYIGSSRNLRQRLSSYASSNGHTRLIRDYLINRHILFRIIESPRYKEYELILMEAFVQTYGKLPILNIQMIVNHHG